jgi:hypothetical protein
LISAIKDIEGFFEKLDEIIPPMMKRNIPILV